MFLPNLRVVHPSLGIGTIVAMRQEGADRILICQFAFPDAAALTLQVTEERSSQSIRKLIEPEEVPLIIAHLERYVPPPAPARILMRKRHFRERFKQLNIYQRCELLRELSQIKSLMPSEQQIMLTIREQLVDELALVSGQAAEDWTRRIDGICGLEPSKPAVRSRDR